MCTGITSIGPAEKPSTVLKAATSPAVTKNTAILRGDFRANSPIRFRYTSCKDATALHLMCCSLVRALFASFFSCRMCLVRGNHLKPGGTSEMTNCLECIATFLYRQLYMQRQVGAGRQDVALQQLLRLCTKAQEEHSTFRVGRSKCTISARLAGRPVLSATRSPTSVETSTCASARSAPDHHRKVRVWRLQDAC